jgi:hypothetical protein
MYEQVFEMILIFQVSLPDFVYEYTCVLSHTFYMTSTLLGFINRFDDVYHSWRRPSVTSGTFCTET